MGLTRFLQRLDYHTSNGTYVKTTEDGPVSGSLQVIPFMSITTVTATADKLWQVVLPAGMTFKVVDVVINAGTIVGTPVVSVGTTAAGTQIAKTTLAATSVGASSSMTIKSYTPAATGSIDVRITAGAGESIALPVSVTVVGYVSNAPTSVRQGTGITAAGTVSAYR